MSVIPGPQIPDSRSPWVRTAEPLFWCSGAGRETRASTDYFYDARYRTDRPHYVLQLTLAGEGFYESRRGSVRLGAGSAWFDRIPGSFSYGFPPGAPQEYELVYVGFAGKVARRWCGRIIRAFGNVFNLGPVNPLIQQMLEIARLRELPTPCDRYTMSAKLYQLLMTLLSTVNASRVATAHRMTHALNIIADRGQDPAFNISALAVALNCSREHLARRFRASTGVSPSDYLMQHRIRLATHEMRDTSDKLELIARRCGFSGANYLCRAFRNHMGLTPARFRALHGTGEF